MAFDPYHDLYDAAELYGFGGGYHISYAVVDTEADTVTINGTFVGNTTIVVTGGNPAKIGMVLWINTTVCSVCGVIVTEDHTMDVAIGRQLLEDFKEFTKKENNKAVEELLAAYKLN